MINFNLKTHMPSHRFCDSLFQSDIYKSWYVSTQDGFYNSQDCYLTVKGVLRLFGYRRNFGLNPGDGGLAEVSAMAGGPRDPPPLNFAQNQFSCPKLGMLIPQGISNYVQFVSYNYLTYPAHGGLPNIPSRNCIC